MTAPPVFLGISLKMYFDHCQTIDWTTEIVQRSDSAQRCGVEVVLMPSFPSLEAVARLGEPHGLKLGAQDLFWEETGAYTGEVSGPSLAQLGCEYVIVGHAERRKYFGEDDDVVARKLASALAAGLSPVVCVGETEPGERGEAARSSICQLKAAVSTIDPRHWGKPIVVAYEPVWAIGQAEPASPAHVRGVAIALREWMQRNWGTSSRVVYGGSAGMGLLAEIGDVVDGLFLGRFAHAPVAFSKILDEAKDFAAHRAK
jgi:triosephosphate isomerase